MSRITPQYPASRLILAPMGERPLYALLSGLDTLAWVLAIVGFARRHFTARPAFLARATEAVYPFYILHQTVAVMAVWSLVGTTLPLSLKFALAVAATFAGSWLLYEGIRRVGWLRPLFGMKAR